jgi:hypothetical protein
VKASRRWAGAAWEKSIATASFGPLDTAPDGRILVMLQVEQGTSPPITLVLNWDAELKK